MGIFMGIFMEMLDEGIFGLSWSIGNLNENFHGEFQWELGISMGISHGHLTECHGDVNGDIVHEHKDLILDNCNIRL